MISSSIDTSSSHNDGVEGLVMFSYPLIVHVTYQYKDVY